MDCSIAKAGLVARIFFIWGTYYKSCNSLLFTLSTEKMCVSGSYSGGCEEFCHLGYNAMQPTGSHPVVKKYFSCHVSLHSIVILYLAYDHQITVIINVINFFSNSICFTLVESSSGVHLQCNRFQANRDLSHVCGICLQLSVTSASGIMLLDMYIPPKSLVISKNLLVTNKRF
jgi:hypothetical protein